MSDAGSWIRVLRASHDHLADLLRRLDADEIKAQSYASEWSIAQVASHLGSQAEIFLLFLNAGLQDTQVPGREQFSPIWDRWNALSPADQVSESVAANEAFVARMEQIPTIEQAAFALSMFGMDLDLAGLAALRLAEHAVHSWDIAVALDPTATLAGDAAELLIDRIDATASRVGKPVPGVGEVVFETTGPQRRFLLDITRDHLTLTPGTDRDAETLQLPAEALIRLVYGRLDPDHTPPALELSETLEHLRTVFPGL
jgi:uncharacterized protein (TIGR03083 family)